MTLRVSGKNLDIGEALRTRVEGRVVEAFTRHFDGGWTGHVTVEREGTGFRTECALHLASGVTLESSGRAIEAYAAADQAVERLETRLKRYTRRLKDRHAGRRDHGVSAATYVLTAPEPESTEEVGEFHPVVVAEATTALPLLSVSEAVVELDFTGAPLLVFRHAGHGGINVVYRRRDGHVGWIDPAQDSASRMKVS